MHNKRKKPNLFDESPLYKTNVREGLFVVHEMTPALTDSVVQKTNHVVPGLEPVFNLTHGQHVLEIDSRNDIVTVRETPVKLTVRKPHPIQVKLGVRSRPEIVRARDNDAVSQIKILNILIQKPPQKQENTASARPLDRLFDRPDPVPGNINHVTPPRVHSVK